MKVYNSLTFQKEEFKSINPDEVLMYVCGPTVYDSPHLGHAKSAITFDLIRRYLRFKGYDVKLIKNYTDIDDKIIERANQKNINFNELSNHYIKEYEDVMKILNIEKDYKNPRATETIEFMIQVIQKLISKEYAYEKNGSVYFRASSFSDYNTLLQNIKESSEEEEEAYLEDQDTSFGEEKESRRDFALWKKYKENEPFWESPWGKGRPGWHIECSAMAINLLGETIDIHGGGQDLKFPHHRNEIAQSEAYTGKKFANYFIHNGFVNVDNEKMSKSQGNFFLVSDVVKKYDPMVIRFFLLSSHYRKSINYSFDNMNQAQKNYNKLINTINKVKDLNPIKEQSEGINELISTIERSELKMQEAMDDDFNTPIVIAEILTLFKKINHAIIEKKQKITEKFSEIFFKLVENINTIFGIFPNLIIGGYSTSMDEKDQLIKELKKILLETRESLREKKLYDISDEIREKLKAIGIKIED